jgi:hypothetical protein
VGVLLFWQVQHGVGWVQVRIAASAVGDPGHVDLPQDRRERASMPGLGAAAGQAHGVGDVADPRFVLRAQVQMVLEQLTEQRPGIDL